MIEQNEIILCPLCGKAIHQHFASPIMSRASIPSRTDPADASKMLTHMMLEAEETHRRLVENAERACVEHMKFRHPVRYRLWRRFRWEALLIRRWPWSRTPTYERFDFPA